VLSRDVLYELELIASINSPDVRVRLYDPSRKLWTKVPIDFVVAAKEGEEIYLKTADVTDCLNFDAILAAAIGQEVVNIRSNLKNDRAYVRHRMKARHSSETTSSNTSDVEEPITPILPASRVGIRAQESARAYSIVKQEPLECLELTDSEDVVQVLPVSSKRKPSTSHPTAPVSQRVRQVSPSPPLILSPPPGEEIDDPIVVDNDAPIWPAEYYVCDIVRGFDECDKARRAGKNVGLTFEALFEVPFRSTTFYDNRKRWESAPQTVRDKAYAAGRTPKGLWTAFMSLSRSARTSARTRVRIESSHKGKGKGREMSRETSESMSEDSA
jgi:hypothetical protein